MNFPFKKYSHFATDWVGIIEEIESTDTSSVKNDNYSFGFKVTNGSFGMTSIVKSRIYPRNNYYTQGDYVVVTFEAFDHNGRERLMGGDFLMAVMFNRTLGKSTAGRVVDHYNGTYSIYFYAAWVGYSEFNVTLHTTREALQWLTTVYRPPEERTKWNATFKDGLRKYRVECSLRTGAPWNNSCEFTKPNTFGQYRIICNKPMYGSCQQLYSIEMTTPSLNSGAAKAMSGKESLFSQPVTSLHMKTTVEIGHSNAGYQRYPMGSVPCGPDMPVPLSDGFWASESVYTSLTCRTQQWSTEQAKRCLAGKQLKMIGDSTLLQWYKSLSSVIRPNWRKISGWTGNLQFKEDDIRVQFHFIGLREGRLQYLEDVLFEGDLIDSIKGSQCTDTVLVFTLGLHFVTWTPRSYIERLYSIRKAVLRLRARCGTKTIVIFKCPHPRDNANIFQRVHSNNALIYDLRRIIRRVLSGIGIAFVEIWDMSLSHASKTVAHMPMEPVIRQQVFIMLSYICPETSENIDRIGSG
ncbi:NXPE family member 1-like [Saccoglossus kowalevskii]